MGNRILNSIFPDLLDANYTAHVASNIRQLSPDARQLVRTIVNSINEARDEGLTIVDIDADLSNYPGIYENLRLMGYELNYNYESLDSYKTITNISW